MSWVRATVHPTFYPRIKNSFFDRDLDISILPGITHGTQRGACLIEVELAQGRCGPPSRAAGATFLRRQLSAHRPLRRLRVSLSFRHGTSSNEKARLTIRWLALHGCTLAPTSLLKLKFARFSTACPRSNVGPNAHRKSYGTVREEEKCVRVSSKR